MNGQLEQQPLAELISEISERGLSGTMRLQHQQDKAAVYFEEGKIVYAASNIAQMRILQYLKQHGLISETKFSALGNNRSDLSLISELCARGILDQAGVLLVISNQVSDLLRIFLAWSNGRWDFDDARLGDPVRVTVDMPALLLQGARNMPWELVASRFHNSDEIISPASGVPDFASLSPADGFVLSRVDGPVTLRDLLFVSGLREEEGTRTIYGLILAGFLQRQHKAIALKSGPRKAARSTPATPVEKKPKVEAVELPERSPEKTEEEELNEFFERLEGAADHYAVLNVNATAGMDEIKKSYYALARRYHPDRFHLQASTPLHGRIEAAFARLAHAYGTLTDERQRSNYDRKLAAQAKAKRFEESAPKATAPPKAAAPRGNGMNESATGNQGDRPTVSREDEVKRAESNFKEGFAALQQGQTKLAVAQLSAASRIAPQEGRYRAYYGKALAALAETRRLAESEMLAAIKLEPGNASYRIMLAELYCELGFYIRAEGEIERALAAEPNNREARAVLRKVTEHRAKKS